ncbi:phage minor capsid protein [Anaerotignum propionicum]|uniref:Phage minor capsid protein 2 n=1 Tax=Anaerotignum propionicum DSM 1682 TaxID=991789 RepID=A0A0X8V957_ANAPI|nr:phage minor capsid protein [Anaerotignum propionicum]AMJ40372.1 phage minor capsid protein 2 [Anaerotignum propionicum DSM 1682]SHE43869.1 Phage minor capsid protein 2 [[Clostridium] propionicum DSM 1682] [Anaerotignum propionicum DSM 1682]
MLKPKYIEQLPENLIELYSQLEQDILADMARRLSTYDYYIPAAQWQRDKLIELGNFEDWIIKALASRTGMTQEEIKALMEEAGMKALKFDDRIYKAAGLNVPPISASPALLDVINTGIRKTNGLFENLTNTTAGTATKQLENALDRAYMQIISGAFDKETSVRNAIKDLARYGVGSITYPTGKIDSLETAVRRAVVTGVNQTALKLQEARAEQMGSDLVETTAHAGARPSHAEWQGKVFSLSGKSKKYPDFKSSTGYGTGAGLGGWNCRHSFYPYLEGSPRAYTNDELKGYNSKNVEYNRKKMTEYEASLQQRSIERNIRRWKREKKAMEAAGLPTEEASAKISKWQAAQRDFIDQTGLKRQYNREQIYTNGVVKSGKDSIIRLNKDAEEYLKTLDFSQMDRYKGKLSNRAVRKWYKHHDESILSSIDQQLPLEERARKACSLRIQYREQARQLMRDEVARKELQEKFPSRTFEQLVAHKKKKYGLSDEEAYQDILRSSQTTNKDFDEKAGV